jgi:hypothetical protein
MRPLPKSTIHRSPLRRGLRIVVWIFLTLLLAILFAAAWAWSNRYELIERQAITYFDSLGIQADLKIRSATLKNADIRNVSLAYDGKPFLQLDRLQAAYQWRDLLDGTVERLDFSGLNATLTVDETGAIIDGWRPPGTGGDTVFPGRGIGVTDASILLQTPYGDVPVTGKGDIKTLDQFELEGELAPVTLTRGAERLSTSGPFTVTSDSEAFTLLLPRSPLTVSHPSGALRDTQLRLDGRIEKATGAVTGTASLTGGAFDSDAGLAGRITKADIEGLWDGAQLSADVTTELTTVRMTEDNRRNDLAKTLSLANVLSDVPAAQNFAPGLVAPIYDLLSGSNVSAALSVMLSDARRSVILHRPVTLQSGQTRAVITPINDTPAYFYETGDDDYAVAINASLSRPTALTLDPLRLRIRSANGISVDGLASASGFLKTRANWRATTQAGRPARIGPLSIGFDYAAPVDAPSKLILRGAADYDGDIPGGYVERLTAGGVLTARLKEDRTEVDLRPDRPVDIARLETTSEWDITDFTGQVRPDVPLYVRQGTARATVNTALIKGQLTASRPASELADAATLDVQFGRADLAGDIRADTQSWDIRFSDLGLQSVTFPVAGTDLIIPSGALTVGLSANARSTFAIKAPTSTLLTPAYSVRGMAFEAAGTAEQYDMAFGQGRINVLNQTAGAFPIPVLPLSGTAVFADGQFTGTAQTSLPRAPDTPIDIRYRLKDGEGDAAIKIDGLRFRPGGLQPQDLVPTLRGKIASVDGSVNADLAVIFGADIAPSGTGTFDIVNMALGTAPGPITGLSGTVELTSLFPVTTAPDQRLSIKTFNPGFPLENGDLTYALVPEGVAISRAVFPLGEGQVSFDPFTWIYGASENRVTLRVSDVEVGDFLKGVGDGKLSISGALEGTVPVVVRGIDVLVEKGRLAVKNGGVIRYQGDDVAAAIPNEYAAKAIQALKAFNYDALFLEINGPLDGEIKLGVEFTGSNPDVLYNVPFQFSVTVEGELFNIARSLNPNGLQQRVLTSVKNKQTPE